MTLQYKVFPVLVLKQKKPPKISFFFQYNIEITRDCMLNLHNWYHYAQYNPFIIQNSSFRDSA